MHTEAAYATFEQQRTNGIRHSTDADLQACAVADLRGYQPCYGSIGIAAPIILVGLRLLQGLALGGEYGGAATYVAEPAPHGKRGAYTSWIQTTATRGLFLSLIIIIGTKEILGDAAFNDWGWRVPFWMSFFLLIISVWIRLSLNETPAFKKMKEEGKTSKAPLTEALANWGNGKIVLLALLGLTAGQGVVWYTGQFYALFFLTAQLKVDPTAAQLMIGAALLLGTPFFIIFGTLSDRIGRKPIIMAGCLIAALTFFPLFKALTEAANPDLAVAQAKNKVTVSADPSQCSFQGSPIAREIDFKTSCDIAKRYLAQSSVSYDSVDGPKGSPAAVTIGDKTITPPAATVANQKFDADSATKVAAFKKDGAEVVYQANVDATQPDMKPDMLRAQNAGAEVIVVWSVTTSMEARMFNTRAAMNWDVSFVGHPSMSSGEIAGLVEKPANWKKVYVVGYKSCSYDAAGKLPPKTQDLVDRLTKANVAMNDTLLWWIAGGVDAIDLIAKGVAESGSTESEGLIKYWNTLSKYPGYFGNYTFTPTQHNGYLTDEIVMSEASTAKNGTFALAPGYA